jgi:hypothetical protein
MNEFLLVKPQWLEKMYPGKTGRDHLGLGSVSSNEILPTLVPSINVLTFHPRYHSFYVFLLDEFWRKDLPRTAKAWRDFFRPRDFIFSVGCHLCDLPEHGEMTNVVGSIVTAPLARSEDAFYTDVDYIKSPLGGYGLYYRTVMAELGIIIPGGPGLPLHIDIPHDVYGKQLAEAFRSCIAHTDYYQHYFDGNISPVPRPVVVEFIRKACLCQLQQDDAVDRPLLRDIFLHNGIQDNATHRKQTLQLFLDIADQSNGSPMNEDTFRQIIMYKFTPDGITYTPRQHLFSIHQKWRLYQIREYYAFAFNAIWWHLCDWGIRENGIRLPISKDRMWAYVQSSLRFDDIAHHLGITAPNLPPLASLSQLVAWLYQVIDATEDTFDNRCTLQSALNEDLLYRIALQNLGDPVWMISGMLLMLLLIYLRGISIRHRKLDEWFIAKMGDAGRLSVDMFLYEVKAFMARGPVTILEFAQKFINAYVIQQHIFTATRKLPDNTFRFQYEGNHHLRFFLHDNFLGFMNSRFDAISTTLYELGYCGNMKLPDHPLREDGWTLLQEMIDGSVEAA